MNDRDYRRLVRTVNSMNGRDVEFRVFYEPRCETLRLKAGKTSAKELRALFDRAARPAIHVVEVDAVDGIDMP